MIDRFDASSSSSEILITRARHRAHMETAAVHLEAFLLLTSTSRQRIGLAGNPVLTQSQARVM